MGEKIKLGEAGVREMEEGKDLRPGVDKLASMYSFILVNNSHWKTTSNDRFVSLPIFSLYPPLSGGAHLFQ